MAKQSCVRFICRSAYRDGQTQSFLAAAFVWSLLASVRDFWRWLHTRECLARSVICYRSRIFPLPLVSYPRGLYQALLLLSVSTYNPRGPSYRNDGVLVGNFDKNPFKKTNLLFCGRGLNFSTTRLIISLTRVVRPDKLTANS